VAIRERQRPAVEVRGLVNWAALVPTVPHIPPWISVLVLTAFLVAFTAVGIRLFLRRAID
jgi:hypothetical protein